MQVTISVLLNCAYLSPVFGRIEGKMEEHSGIYECIFEANPQIKGEVNISGNFISLLLGSEEGLWGSCDLLNTLLEVDD